MDTPKSLGTFLCTLFARTHSYGSTCSRQRPVDPKNTVKTVDPRSCCEDIQFAW